MKTYEYMAIAFIIENKGSDHSLEQFVVTIDELENILKIDFFPFLENSYETQLEAKRNIEKWKF